VLVGIAALSFVLSFVGAAIGFMLDHFHLPLTRKNPPPQNPVG
jgi:hypothetical protein